MEYSTVTPDARMVCKLLCFIQGYNFKSHFVKAGHEQVRSRKCILFLRKIMITKGTKTKFILLKGLGLNFKNVLYFVHHVHIKHLNNYIENNK